MKPKTMTEAMFSAKAPYNNPYQGDDKKVLFVCSAGLLRSATAARIYARKYNTRAAGSASYALIPLSDNLVVWADEIVFVSGHNYFEACANYNFEEFLGGKKIRILDIPDDFEHMHPELIREFKEQYEDF